MTGETNDRAGSGCPKWLKIAFIASLALNVIVVGVFAGFSMKESRGGSGPGRQIEWIIKLVPEERRDFAKSQFEPLREVLAVEQRKRVQHLAEIVDAIRSEPFVPDTLSAVLSTRRTSSSKRREIVQEQLVALLSEFSADERQMFADGVEDQVRRWRAARAERASK